MADVLGVIMRWLHLASVAALIGGLLYGGQVLSTAAKLLPSSEAEKLGEGAAARFRFTVYAAISALVISGIYNLLSSPGHSVRYLILLAVKLLLVLHVFAVAILSVQPKRERRARMMAGAGISGLVIILISAYLRRIF